ncbi:MAG: exodeoxyribonuclease [Abditibacteriota bacterium]|nr:exodeoxyribonuclease [Abditibacteriota bacterium]
MKIATWNVNGIRARQAQFSEWVERDEPDVICLQELKASPEQVPARLSELPYWSFWHGSGGYSGVSLHISHKLAAQPVAFAHPTFDFECRIVQAQIGATVFASIYVPNGGKDFAAKLSFLQAMKAYATEVHGAGLNLILCGDMNVARTEQDVHPRERRDVIGQRSDERLLFEDVIGQGLVDVGRALDPQNEELFTWWAPWRQMRQRNIGWRIDYILASAALAQRASDCAVFPTVGTSDHAPVMATFDWPQ